MAHAARLCLAASLLLCAVAVRASAPTGATPRPVSLDGILHVGSDDTLAFTRDGDTVFFDRSEDPVARVMHTWRSRYRDGKFLPPERARLADPDVSTHDPAVAPDESFIVFDYGKAWDACASRFAKATTGAGPSTWARRSTATCPGAPTWLRTDARFTSPDKRASCNCHWNPGCAGIGSRVPIDAALSAAPSLRTSPSRARAR